VSELNPICPTCKRVIRKRDRWVLRGGAKVHAPNTCRGPHVKKWYVVGYRDEQPVSVALLPETIEEVRELADKMVHLEIRLKKMNLGQLTTVVNKVLGEAP